MNGKVAKRLRKEISYKKTRTVEVVGDYNINLGFTVLNVPKTQVVKISDIESARRSQYKSAKRNYKAKV